jgi:hypothetical protein
VEIGWKEHSIDRALDNDNQWDWSRAAPIKFSIMAVSGVPTMMVKIEI